MSQEEFCKDTMPERVSEPNRENSPSPNTPDFTSGVVGRVVVGGVSGGALKKAGV